MRNFQEKKGLKYFLQLKPVLILLFLIVILFTWNIIGLTKKLQETHKNKKLQEAEISNLEKRKEKLSSDIEKLGTDKGKEEMIRENFGLAKEGENIIVIVEDKNQTKTSAVEKENKFFSFFKELFTN
jgi:cell division protein FtsB